MKEQGNDTAYNGVRSYGRINITIFYFFLMLLAWTGVVYASLYWNLSNVINQVRNLATAEARANWNKDQAFRKWATLHGGVYVVPNKRTPPNPGLAHIPDRDVSTTSGKKLTLMNPAYMLRQMTEEYEEAFGIKGSITGKVLLNPPINQPDEWQLRMLERFEQERLEEVVEETEINGEPFIRYMKPMYMTKGCEKCHGHLGFREGDLRGGVSVSIPLQPFLVAASETTTIISVSHILVWLTGALVIAAFMVSVRKREKVKEEYQKKLQQEHDLLDQRVRERTAELEKARHVAEEASQTKSEFLSRMSHELRTPLNAILGFAQLMKLDEQEKKQETTDPGSLDEILTAGTHLLELINEVLDISRIESGKYDLEVRQVDLGELLQSVVQLLQPMAQEKNVEIINRAGAAGCTVETDEKCIKQVLINLVNNAIKYNDASGNVITEIEKLDGGQYKITVSDNGHGIPGEYHDRIFEPFERLGKEYGEEEGTGVGLTVCKQIVDLLGGKIGFQSNENEGSIFWVILPAEFPGEPQ